jgi:hypothetical protein
VSHELLIRHCSPTLAGIKTGNLFTCACEQKESIRAEIRKLNGLLGPKGLRILPLKFFRKRVLIYVYRPACLAADLKQAEAEQILQEAGYSVQTANQCVVELARRLNTREDFPHEIGLFLSYPPEDVKGFIEMKGSHCKCTGYWKVYGDETVARQQFQKYKTCTEHYHRQWPHVSSIDELAVRL